MPPPRKPHPNAARLSDPELRTRIRVVIGGKVRAQDVDDVVQQVYLRLATLIESLPASREDLLGLTGVITHGRVVDYIRHGVVHDGRSGEVEDLEDLPPAIEPLSSETRADCNERLAVVDEAIAAGEVPPEALRWGRGLAVGKTIAQMAEEDGVSESKIKMVLKRARDVLGPRWKAYVAVGSVMLLALVLVLGATRRRPTLEATPDDQAMRPTAPTSSAAASTSAEPVQTPQDLRATAKIECVNHDWESCGIALDRAAEQDPESELQPEVIAMRKAIAAGLKADELPPKPRLK